MLKSKSEWIGQLQISQVLNQYINQSITASTNEKSNKIQSIHEIDQCINQSKLTQSLHQPIKNINKSTQSKQIIPKNWSINRIINQSIHQPIKTQLIATSTNKKIYQPKNQSIDQYFNQYFNQSKSINPKNLLIHQSIKTWTNQSKHSSRSGIALSFAEKDSFKPIFKKPLRTKLSSFSHPIFSRTIYKQR